MNTSKKIPVNAMYKQRKDFIVVALTGITGSGCSDLAELMSKGFTAWNEQKREPAEIHSILKNADKQDVIFFKKYELCHNVCAKQYEEFEIIKYRNVLLLFAMEHYAKEVESYEDFITRIHDLLLLKFDKSHEREQDVKDAEYLVDNYFSPDELIGFGLSGYLYEYCKALTKLKDDREYRKCLYDLYKDNKFTEFCENLYDAMKQRDYYAKNFFVHRLAVSLRATANPDSVITSADEQLGNDYIFCIVEKINDIIKGAHYYQGTNNKRRFVIDSLKNSMEMLYLRERFTAFYTIAVHNDGEEKQKILDKICKTLHNKSYDLLSEKEQHDAKVTAERMWNLNNTEKDKKDFENGKFYGPDISRCVTESEIHISFKSWDDENKAKRDKEKSFYSFGEQWMKFYSLIVRPGLITPSRDERCMSIAYVAKFNSGCISRQVGCAIVDKEYAVQSIGWNDPPYNQLPCQLRYADDLCNDATLRAIEELGIKNCIYSKFETDDETPYVTRDKILLGNGFRDCLSNELRDDTLSALRDNGLKYPYCFRTRYNTYRDQKDQVNTRSLHAEENTMLRISRVGGQGLQGGTMYVTASPCILCSKKAYQIGIETIVYLDPYTDMAPDLILNCGWHSPHLRPFIGAIGTTFYKLYQPFLPYKDELAIWDKN